MKDASVAKPRRAHAPWRENIEALVVAVAMAVFLKYFVVEAYKIPTGSMQPTLMGQPLASGGGVFDRILVDKLSYHLRAPQRFEVVVFKYPLDRAKNYVKRLWGLPGEDVRIAGGDVWVRAGSGAPWVIPRRPAAVQRETWRELDLDDEDGALGWRPEVQSWSAGERSLAARGPGRARFVAHGPGPILDGYLDGYPRSVRRHLTSKRSLSGFHAVGDLRVEGRLRALAGSQAVAVELTEGQRRYRLELPGPAAPPDAAPQIVLLGEGGAAPGGPSSARAEPWRLPAGRWVEFSAQNLDDELLLECDGGPSVRLAIAAAADSTATVEIAQAGEGADLEDLQVYRDVYYTASRGGTAEWSIPAEHYFMLGDNTLESADSREWEFVEMLWRDESGAERRALANRREVHAPDANPQTFPTETGYWVRFRDEWGEPHEFPAPSELHSPNARLRSPEPFVHQQLITGRAVLVFWPIAPHKGLWRLRWVR